MLSKLMSKRIESASIVFMGCSSSSLFFPPAMVGGWQKTEKEFRS